MTLLHLHTDPCIYSFLFSDLSNTMVGALSVSPLFSFPFYGHLVSELFITTHGFLSLSPRLHDYIYKTQYIAPLRIKVSSQYNSTTVHRTPRNTGCLHEIKTNQNVTLSSYSTNQTRVIYLYKLEVVLQPLCLPFRIVELLTFKGALLDIFLVKALIFCFTSALNASCCLPRSAQLRRLTRNSWNYFLLLNLLF